MVRDQGGGPPLRAGQDLRLADAVEATEQRLQLVGGTTQCAQTCACPLGVIECLPPS